MNPHVSFLHAPAAKKRHCSRNRFPGGSEGTRWPSSPRWCAYVHHSPLTHAPLRRTYLHSHSLTESSSRLSWSAGEGFAWGRAPRARPRLLLLTAVCFLRTRPLERDESFYPTATVTATGVGDWRRVTAVVASRQPAAPSSARAYASPSASSHAADASALHGCRRCRHPHRSPPLALVTCRSAGAVGEADSEQEAPPAALACSASTPPLEVSLAASHELAASYLGPPGAPPIPNPCPTRMCWIGSLRWLEARLLLLQHLLVAVPQLTSLLRVLLPQLLRMLLGLLLLVQQHVEAVVQILLRLLLLVVLLLMQQVRPLLSRPRHAPRAPPLTCSQTLFLPSAARARRHAPQSAVAQPPIRSR